MKKLFQSEENASFVPGSTQRDRRWKIRYTTLPGHIGCVIELYLLQPFFPLPPILQRCCTHVIKLRVGNKTKNYTSTVPADILESIVYRKEVTNRQLRTREMKPGILPPTTTTHQYPGLVGILFLLFSCVNDPRCWVHLEHCGPRHLVDGKTRRVVAKEEGGGRGEHARHFKPNAVGYWTPHFLPAKHVYPAAFQV